MSYVEKSVRCLYGVCAWRVIGFLIGTLTVGIAYAQTPGVQVRASNSNALNNWLSERVQGAGPDLHATTSKVRLATAPTGDVTVNVTSNDTAAIGLGDNASASGNSYALTFNTTNWNTEQSVWMKALDDSDSTSEAITLTFDPSGANYNSVDNAQLSFRVRDDDSGTSQGVTVSFPSSLTTSGLTEEAAVTGTARLAEQPSGNVTVAITSSIASVKFGTSNTASLTLTFSQSNWNTAQNVRISAAADANLDDETAVVTFNPDGSDYSAVPSETLSFTVNDNDTRSVTLNKSTVTVTEGSEQTYTVVLSALPVGGNVTINVSGTGSGITTDPTSLTFSGTTWNTAQPVTVEAAEDDNSANESVTLTHTPTGGGYTGVTVDSVVATASDNDTPRLVMSTTTLAVVEADASVNTYTVRLFTEPNTANVTVTVGSSIAAVAVDTNGGMSGVQTTLTFSTSTWNTAQPVTVSAPADNNATDETATLTHTVTGSSEYAGLQSSARPSVTVTVDDKDTQGLEFNTAGPVVLPEDGSGSYSVRLTAEPTGAVTVTVASSDTAAATVDTVAGGGLQDTLTFAAAAWNTYQPVTVIGVADNDNSNEALTLSHEASGGDYGSVSKSLSATVTDVDIPGVKLAGLPTSVTEGASAMPTVRLTTEPAGDVTVAITDNHPDVTIDAPTTLTFSSSTWNTVQSFTMRVAEDDDGESEEVTLTFNPNGANYNGVASATSTVTLTDNDPRGVTLSTSTLQVQESNHTNYTVVLDTEPVNGHVMVMVAGAENGITAAPTSLTFRASNWDTAQAVTVRAANDLNGVSETATLTHTVSGGDYGRESVTADSVSVSTLDDDNPSLRVTPVVLTMTEGGSDTSYRVQLNTNPGGDVTVAVSGTSTAVTVDPSSLTFASSTWSTIKTVTVKAPEDDDATSDTTILTHTASGAAAYTGLGSLAQPSVSVTVTDNDTPELVVDTNPATDAVDVNTLELNELSTDPANTKEYTVRLKTEPTDTVEVAIDTGDPALGVDTDSSPQTKTLTFTTTNWDTAQTVTAKALEDHDSRDETALTISHLASGGDYQGKTATLQARVVDDDSPRLIVDEPTETSLKEGNTASTSVVRLRLATEPTGEVTVVVTSDNASLTIDAPATLTFATTTWNMPQAVTTSAPGEDDDGMDETVTLTFNPAGAEYDTAPSATTTIAITDDDPRGVTLSESTLQVPEGESANYTVVLDTEPVNGRVTVTVAGAENGITAAPTSLTFRASNWNTARTVTVRAANDDENMLSEVVTLTHEVSGADYGLAGTMTVDSVVVTAVDDDTPRLVVSTTTLSVAEGGSNNYQVRLNTDPGADVTVTVGGTTAAVTVDTDSGTTGNQSTLMFTSSNWGTDRTVSVSAAEDDNGKKETLTLTHTVTSSTSTVYTSLAPSDRPGVSVTVDDNDPPALVIDADPTTLDVDDGPLALNELQTDPANSKEYTVRLDTEPTTTVEVAIDTGDSAVEVDSDLTPQTKTLTFLTANWDTAQTVTATASQDDDGGDETLTISHTASGGEYVDVSATLQAKVADDDPRGVTVASGVSVTEGSSATTTVQLATQPLGTVRVAVTSDNADVTIDAPTTLTFNAATWDTSQAVAISAGEDDDGANETVTLTFNPRGADYGLVVSATSTISVTDNDPRGVTLSGSTLQVQEGESANYTVVLDTEPVSGNVTVTVGGAANGITANPTALTFRALNWDTAQTVAVAAANDDGNSASETATLTHAVSGADYGTAGVTAGTVDVTTLDDDTPRLVVSTTTLPVAEGGSNNYQMRLNTDPGDDVTVTVGGTTTAVTVDTDGGPGNQSSLTFTSSNWGTDKTVSVSVAEDDNATNEMLTLTHVVVTSSTSSAYASLASEDRPSVSVTVNDNDDPALVIDADPATIDVDAGPLALNELSGDSANSKEYTVRLETEPTTTVEVDIDTGDLAVGVDTDSTPRTKTLTFAVNAWNTAQTVTATAREDDDGGDETLTISHTARGGDYADISASLEAKVTDDDPRGLTVASGVSVTEGSSVASTVQLATQPTGEVTVAITSDNADVTIDAPTTLTFDDATWNTPQMFTIRAGEDDDGADETVTLTFDPDGEDYVAVMSTTSMVTLTDNDPRGVTLSLSSVLVPEASNAMYTVKLDTQPTMGNVTITVGGAASGLTTSPTSLTFTATNWGTVQTVTVHAAADANSAYEIVTLTHTVSGGDYGPAGVTADDVTATSSDDEAAGLQVNPRALEMTEGGSDTYRVRLNTDPGGNVTVTVGGTTAAVTVDTDDGTTGNQLTLTFSTSTWETMQVVSVSAAEDDDATGETPTLTHTVTSSTSTYASLSSVARPSVSVTVDDNDTPALVIDADPLTVMVVEAGPLALNELQTDSANSKEYTVRLATEPTAAVTVSVASGDRAVEVDTDSTPRMKALTFAVNAWNTAQTVTAMAAEDDDASDEQVSIVHSANGGDYDDVSAQLTAKTTDDDTQGLLLATSTLASSGVDEGGTATYTMRLTTEPAGTVTVSVTATGDAEVDLDGGQAGRQSSLRFDAMNWNTAREAVVRGLSDDDAADDTATLRHTTSGADYDSVQPVETTFTVHDDDTPAVLVGATALNLNEGSTATYTVVLETQPVGDSVTVSAVSSAVTVATVSPATLRFGAGDWDVPKTFQVRGVADANDVDDSATMTHTVSGADYNVGVTASPVPVTVRDVDAAGIRIDPLALTLDEGGRGIYRVRLNTNPGGNVTVTAATDSTKITLDSDATPQEKELTFTANNWNRQQTVSAMAESDDGLSDEMLTVTHEASGYVGVLTGPDLPVTVKDDDAPGLLFDPPGGLQLKEGDPTASQGTYTARLAFAPSGSVTVTIASDDTGVTVNPNQLVFNMTNWSTPKTVAVTAISDADSATETATLLHKASGGGYDGVTKGYAVQVLDANAAPMPTGVSASSAGPTSLAVRWTPSAGTQGYVVQWRRAGEAWSTARQQTLAAGARTARIDGLTSGVEYQVRVLGLNQGDMGVPSVVVRATPTDVGGGNRAPVVAAELEIETLSLGETRTVDLRDAFADPDGDALTYETLSLDASIVVATVSGAELQLRVVSAGAATVYVWAVDPAGLQVSQALLVMVSSETRPSLSAADAQAPEGGMARLVVQLSAPRQTATRFLWSMESDANPATADADAADLVETSGEAMIPAGATSTEVAIAIADDAKIEPPREWFAVSLSAPDGCCVVSNRRARVAVLEGVCDRTPAVRDALRGDDSCTVPTLAALAAVQTLTVSGAKSLQAGDFGGLTGLQKLDMSNNGLAALPATPFADISSLRRLMLDGNALETLPADLFTGLNDLREVSLDDNPGAPFPLKVELVRTDADSWAPGPATVEARIASGAPFALRATLSAEESAPSGLPAMVEIGVGRASGMQFQVPAAQSALRLQAGSVTVPTNRCGQSLRLLCFRGFKPMLGSTLTLYQLPPLPQPVPELEPLEVGNALRLPLASLIDQGEAGGLRWQASSSDESVATVRVVGDTLVVEQEPGSEGMVEIVLVATDEDGLTATQRFKVHVDFYWPVRQATGWRSAALMESATRK